MPSLAAVVSCLLPRHRRAVLAALPSSCRACCPASSSSTPSLAVVPYLSERVTRDLRLLPIVIRSFLYPGCPPIFSTLSGISIQQTHSAGEPPSQGVVSSAISLSLVPVVVLSRASLRRLVTSPSVCQERPQLQQPPGASPTAPLPVAQQAALGGCSGKFPLPPIWFQFFNFKVGVWIKRASLEDVDA
ncbi:unnamed protein product [Cuscuta campestris]|uniref:Uncharacterized protein n=1 Tax=Cuscuta campestris TaxID=132261 RepID=A0A484NPP8_9ASTE|nr:unnamed protein product [Cuscuta campestris]